MRLVVLFLLLVPASVAFAQLPPFSSQASRRTSPNGGRHGTPTSRYKLDITLEKMSPVLKGHMEIRCTSERGGLARKTAKRRHTADLILDWRKLPDHEKDSTLSNVTVNGEWLQGHDGSLFIDDVSRPRITSTGRSTSSSVTARPGRERHHARFHVADPDLRLRDHAVHRQGGRFGIHLLALCPLRRQHCLPGL